MTLGAWDGSKIRWKVLQRNGRYVLVISEHVLLEKQYHESLEHISWEECTLRQWLNGEFYEETFLEEEKEAISLTTVTADKNPKYDTDPGRNTQDKVFLLSIADVNQYFSNNAERTGVNGNGSSSWWWMRSPGSKEDHAANISSGGSVDSVGHFVSYRLGVRPAMWVDLEA